MQKRSLVRQPTHASVELSGLALQTYILQGLFHGRIAQGKSPLHEADAWHGLHSNGRATCLALRRMRLHQGQQIGPRHHQVHPIVRSFSLARALGRERESGSRKTLLFHFHLTSEQGHRLTCADHP